MTIRFRPGRGRPKRPPAPRIDATTDIAEQRLFEETFAESIWRRAIPR